nr:xylulose kinase-1 [Tanacetum cinerariifolium]
MIKVLPPKTAIEVMARERERKAKTTLLMALLEDHLEKFRKMADAKEVWEAIKSRFGGNDESKKMHKYLLKQQFESFSVSTSKGLHKGYDRHYQEYRHGVLTEEKIEQIEKEKSSFYDQGHQQAAKGKEDDEEFGDFCWW